MRRSRGVVEDHQRRSLRGRIRRAEAYRNLAGFARLERFAALRLDREGSRRHGLHLDSQRRAFLLGDVFDFQRLRLAGLADDRRRAE